MNLLKRLQRLWQLSEVPPELEYLPLLPLSMESKYGVGKGTQQGQIIRKKIDPIEEIINS